MYLKRLMEDSPQQSYTAAVGFFSHLNHTKQMALVLTRISWLHLSRSSSQNKHCHRCTRAMCIQIPSELACPSYFSLCGLIGICLWWKFPGTPATGTLTGCVFLHPSSCLPPSSLLLSATSYNDSQHPASGPSLCREESWVMICCFSFLSCFCGICHNVWSPWWYQPISKNANQWFLNIKHKWKKKNPQFYLKQLSFIVAD